MRHIPVEPPAFFHRGPSPLARLTFVGLISLALLFADTRFRYLEHVRYVTRVYSLMSEVTIVTDKDHAVPVKVERSGVRSVMFGAGAGRLPELRFVAPSADIAMADKLVTSGIDGTYPPGLAVAQVATVER